MNLSTNKVIRINIENSKEIKFNIGTLLKYLINEFINLQKDYIFSKVCAQRIIGIK